MLGRRRRDRKHVAVVPSEGRAEQCALHHFWVLRAERVHVLVELRESIRKAHREKAAVILMREDKLEGKRVVVCAGAPPRAVLEVAHFFSDAVPAYPGSSNVFLRPHQRSQPLLVQRPLFVEVDDVEAVSHPRLHVPHLEIVPLTVAGPDVRAQHKVVLVLAGAHGPRQVAAIEPRFKGQVVELPARRPLLRRGCVVVDSMHGNELMRRRQLLLQVLPLLYGRE
mmetsp:Transcript_59680/g.142728  ORF Transcript_59680/g.142728 Transcript_59680/m.142728 type:complete len:224 (+) Transcript_59680:1197-1868(+)